MNKIALLLFILPYQLFSQLTVIGTLTDFNSKAPIDYANVFIDGTSRGTISDSCGFFMLNDLPEQCKIVFSCIGYETEIININDIHQDKLNLNLALTKKEFQLSEIVVKDKNLRKKNLVMGQKL